jgi:hypothetical protein
MSGEVLLSNAIPFAGGELRVIWVLASHKYVPINYLIPKCLQELARPTALGIAGLKDDVGELLAS